MWQREYFRNSVIGLLMLGLFTSVFVVREYSNKTQERKISSEPSTIDDAEPAPADMIYSTNGVDSEALFNSANTRELLTDLYIKEFENLYAIGKTLERFVANSSNAEFADKLTLEEVDAKLIEIEKMTSSMEILRKIIDKYAEITPENYNHYALASIFAPIKAFSTSILLKQSDALGCAMDIPCEDGALTCKNEIKKCVLKNLNKIFFQIVTIGIGDDVAKLNEAKKKIDPNFVPAAPEVIERKLFSDFADKYDLIQLKSLKTLTQNLANKN